MNAISIVFKAATDTTDCPTCEQPAGLKCVDRNDEPISTIHYSRLEVFTVKIGGAATLRRLVKEAV